MAVARLAFSYFKEERRIPYIVFPHGMLDPWFKKAYPFKHLKKQIYWWWRQGKILREAYAVCFTTEEKGDWLRKHFCHTNVGKRSLVWAQSILLQIWSNQKDVFKKLFPQIEGKRILLYLVGFIPRRGWIHYWMLFTNYHRKKRFWLLPVQSMKKTLFIES